MHEFIFHCLFTDLRQNHLKSCEIVIVTSIVAFVYLLSNINNKNNGNFTLASCYIQFVKWLGFSCPSSFYFLRQNILANYVKNVPHNNFFLFLIKYGQLNYWTLILASYTIFAALEFGNHLVWFFIIFWLLQMKKNGNLCKNLVITPIC